MKTNAVELTALTASLQPTILNHKQNRLKRTPSTSLLALAVTVMFFALSLSAHAADTLTPVQLATEIMMHSQANAADFIAAQIGIDANSGLGYSSYVDPAGQSFRFSLNSDTTYLSQPLAVTASGIFAASTQTWNVSYSISYGRTQWTFNNSFVLSVGPAASLVTATSVTSWDSGGSTYVFNGANGENCTATMTSGGIIHSAAYCYYTKDGQQDGPGFWLYDEFSVIEETVSWLVLGNSSFWNFSEYTTGSLPVSGGKGSFSGVLGPAQAACITCSNTAQ
ncbi:MAG: hypothetical protein WA655_00615 [Candidatus Korobacteraceae bacterium]